MRTLPGIHAKRINYPTVAGGTVNGGNMNFQRPGFLLVIILAGAVATPAWGQSVAPSAGPVGSGTQSAASILDFSGTWAHPSLGFENRTSGPGPVRNRSRTPSGASNFNLLVGDYTNPILKP